MSFCLSKLEIQEITGKKKPSAQAKALNHMGIYFVTRPDGTLMVLPEVAMKRAGHMLQNEQKRPKMGLVR